MAKSLTTLAATRRLIVVVGVVAALAAAVSAGASAAADEPKTLAAPPVPTRTSWPKNDRGLTYGSGDEAKDAQYEPDLIKVEATNGKVGYALRSDLEGPTPRSPQEALQWQAEQAGRDEEIPVYESDGTTRIGVFVVGH